MGAELGQLGQGAKFVRLEPANARALRHRGQDEHQRPEGEVGQPIHESNAEHVPLTVGLRARAHRGQRKSGGPRCLEQPSEENAGHDGPCEQGTEQAEALSRGPAEESERADDEQRQSDEERDGLGEHAREVVGPEKFAGDLQQGDSAHHQDAESVPPPRVNCLERAVHRAIVCRSAREGATHGATP